MPQVLHLFLTKGMSIQEWADKGMLNREFALYKLYLSKNMFSELVVYTYGDPTRDTEVLQQQSEIDLDRITIRKVGLQILLSRIQSQKSLHHFVKSNQVRGSLWACAFAKRHRIPFVARCGYLPSKFTAREQRWVRSAWSKFMESISFGLADKVIVASQADAKAHAMFCQKLLIIPNYIDTETFFCGPQSERKKQFLFVGRFEAQKNIPALLKAFASIDSSNLELVLIGSGSEQETVLQFAEAQKNIKVLDNMTSEELAQKMRESQWFILPSLYEGTPKVLMEAYSSGCHCIVTPMEEIADLCEQLPGIITANSFEGTDIQEALSLAIRTEYSPSEHAAEEFSLQSYCNQEYDVFNNLRH